MYAISVSFGHVSQNGVPVDQLHISAAEDKILATFALLFHGGHLHQERGSFQDHDGLVMFENCSIASCETPKLGREHERVLREAVSNIRCALDQESVLLTIIRIDGRHHWVSQ